jgi:cobalt-zinc-cadmium efflux system membrane fusion protein
MRPITRGRILKVNARLGDRVRAEEVLATYDNIELGEAVGQYGVGLAEIKRAQSGAEVARRSVERAQNLVELGAVAKAELERRSAEHANAQSTIETQRAELARIEEKLHRFGMTDDEIQEMNRSGDIQRHREVSQSTLRAPFSGVITNVNVVEGETVETDREMFTIADLSVVWVQANIYEKDIGSVRKGVPAIVSVDAYPEEIFKGQLTYISDVLDPKTRTVKVRCEVPNPGGRLKLDMFTMIDIPTPADRKAVMIPGSSIQQINDQPVVFVQLTETEFQKRLVQLGVKDGDWIEAVTGIKPGEAIVTDGSFQLKSISLRELIGEKE